jgi:hypothetical protein
MNFPCKQLAMATYYPRQHKGRQAPMVAKRPWSLRKHLGFRLPHYVETWLYPSTTRRPGRCVSSQDIGYWCTGHIHSSIQREADNRAASSSPYKHENQGSLIFWFCLSVLLALESELSNSYLLSRNSTTWATPPALFCFGCFRDRVSWTIYPDWLQTSILLISAS